MIAPLPDYARDLRRVVSVSGGKDSAATVLALREAGLEAHHCVFADTGWEAPETYEYLGTMERVLGIKIDRVGVPGGMRAKIRARAGFPARMQRWCTRELKIDPITEFCDRVAEAAQIDVVQVVGIRAEESAARAQMKTFERDDSRDVYVWRPIMEWAIADVLAIHHRHGLPVNPLYKRGHNRVGCWPCIFASKDEIRLWAQHDPGSVAEVAALESECERERERRNAETPGRYTHSVASYFQSREASTGADGRRVYLPVHVDRVVEWSRTARGGSQMRLILQESDGGCFRWGLCEPPTKDGDER